MKWRNWLNAVIGLWFLLAPWILGFSSSSGAVWTSVVLGIIQLLAAAWAASIEEASGWNVWQSWVSLITGIWFIIQPFVLSLSGNSGELWTGIILGIVTAILSLWNMATKEAS